MLKKIFGDLELTETLGFVVLCFLLVLYFYFNPSTIRESETQVVNITLSEKPKFSPETYEILASLKLVTNEFDQPFKLKECSLDLIDKFDLLKLNVGDKLKITAKTNDLNSGKTVINNFISAYGIELPNGENILELEHFNSCKKNDWKIFNALGVILIIVLVGGFIKKIRKE